MTCGPLCAPGVFSNPWRLLPAEPWSPEVGVSQEERNYGLKQEPPENSLDAENLTL